MDQKFRPRGGQRFFGPVISHAASGITLALLEYYVNGVKLAQAVQPPFSFSFTPPLTRAKYVLSAVATDSTDLATISDPTTVVADPAASTVNIALSGTSTVVEGGAKAIVVISWTGDITSPLTVTYKAKGAAQPDMDYKKLSGTVTIPAGAVKAKIKIKSSPGLIGAGTLKLKLMLVTPSDDSYTVDVGTVKIKLVGR